MPATPQLPLTGTIFLSCTREILCGSQLAVDFHVTQTVNGEKGVHGMLRKGLLF